MLEKVIKSLEEKKPIRMADWLKPADVETLNTYQLLSAKPAVYLVNMSEADYIRKSNKWYQVLLQILDFKRVGFGKKKKVEKDKRLGRFSWWRANCAFLCRPRKETGRHGRRPIQA